MEKVIHKYGSFAEADKAELEFYRRLTAAEKLQMLLDLIMPENPDEAVIQRSARVYPLAQRAKG
jgi:hypothetical protein